MKNLLPALSITLCFLSCESSVPQDSPTENAVTLMESSPIDAQNIASGPQGKSEEISGDVSQKYLQAHESDTIDRKMIIKDGNMSIKSKDIAASKKRIDHIVSSKKAYYEKEELQTNDRTITYMLKIRIPSDSLERFMATIENGKDEIQSKSIQARDVTAEYIDIKARLQNKRDYLKRYKEILSKAATVKDILSIEENILALQEEIESKDGQLKYLQAQVAYSTLEINLFEHKAYVFRPEQQDGFFERVKTALHEGWNSVVNFILWTFSVWPAALLVVLITAMIIRMRRKRRMNMNQIQDR